MYHFGNLVLGAATAISHVVHIVHILPFRAVVIFAVAVVLLVRVRGQEVILLLRLSDLAGASFCTSTFSGAFVLPAVVVITQD